MEGEKEVSAIKRNEGRVKRKDNLVGKIAFERGKNGKKKTTEERVECVQRKRRGEREIWKQLGRNTRGPIGREREQVIMRPMMMMMI